ncbi:13292_t:CDS:2 [Acaulospora morrowiae]|uniref:13292_t:CDS:1 n=1 Tax=Acaulospora morrowiae TaxID=94023 RepID=A0A9N9GX48_9GLOM|nr:13292_t:CDS:2 [Acaulospora morrowiae]
MSTYEPYIGYNGPNASFGKGLMVKYERLGKWLTPYWDGIIKEYKRTQLKGFAYKIIYYETPERIPEEYQKSDLCGVCREELLPQLTDSITILTCGHVFHCKCLGREPVCLFCSEEQGSTKHTFNSNECYEYNHDDNNDHDNQDNFECRLIVIITSNNSSNNGGNSNNRNNSNSRNNRNNSNNRNNNSNNGGNSNNRNNSSNSNNSSNNSGNSNNRNNSSSSNSDSNSSNNKI